ncbi:MAG: RNA polymerase sigma factor [Planctomycetota bacterium]|nr:RNA polymerase sigma factor [Planctomycetota bacterium]
MTAVQHFPERTQPAHSDAALLERFATQGDGEAFRALVDRHAGMVFAACLRVLGDRHGAEDAAQAVFLLLARKARGLGPGVVLAGWLYKTAVFAAREAKRGRAIRARHEREAVVMRDPASDAATEAAESAAWEALRGELDRALSALPAAQRDAIVLRFLEGRSLEDAARELNVPAGTLSARVSRGLDRLREALARRGVTHSAGALGVLLAGRAFEEAPEHLAASIHAACLGTAGASAGSMVLVEAMMRTMLWFKIKVVAAAACVALALGIGVPLAVSGAGAEERPVPPATPAASAAPAAGPAAKPGAATFVWARLVDTSTKAEAAKERSDAWIEQMLKAKNIPAVTGQGPWVKLEEKPANIYLSLVQEARGGRSILVSSRQAAANGTFSVQVNGTKIEVPGEAVTLDERRPRTIFALTKYPVENLQLALALGDEHGPFAGGEAAPAAGGAPTAREADWDARVAGIGKTFGKRVYEMRARGKAVGRWTMTSALAKDQGKEVIVFADTMTLDAGRDKVSVQFETRCVPGRLFEPLRHIVTMDSGQAADDEEVSPQDLTIGADKIAGEFRGRKIEVARDGKTPLVVVTTALYRVLEALPHEAGCEVAFDALEGGTQVKPGGKVRCVGEENLTVNGKDVKVWKYEYTNPRARPTAYWTDERHRLVRMQLDHFEMFLTEDAGRNEEF